MYYDNLKHGIDIRISQVLSDTKDLLAHILFLTDKCKTTKERLDAAEATIAELIATTYDDAEQIAELKRRVAAFERDKERNTYQQEHRERESTRTTCGSASDSQTLVDRGRRVQQATDSLERCHLNSETARPIRQDPANHRAIPPTYFPPPTRRDTIHARPIFPSAPVMPDLQREMPINSHHNGREYAPEASIGRRPRYSDRRAPVVDGNVGRTGTRSRENRIPAPLSLLVSDVRFSTDRRSGNSNSYSVPPYDPRAPPYGFTSNRTTPNMPTTSYTTNIPYDPNTVRRYTNGFLPGNHQR